MTCRFLRRGLRVLYADVDVFFVQSPFYHDMQAPDTTPAPHRNAMGGLVDLSGGQGWFSRPSLGALGGG